MPTHQDTGQLPAELDAVIIGSGQAGLSCGATLAQFGERVVVLEQHEVTGGDPHPSLLPRPPRPPRPRAPYQSSPHKTRAQNRRLHLYYPCTGYPLVEFWLLVSMATPARPPQHTGLTTPRPGLSRCVPPLVFVGSGGAHSFAVAGKSKWHFDAGLHITIPPHEYVLQAACGSVTPPVVFNRLADEHGASDYIALGGAPSGEAPLPVVAGPLSGKLNLEEELVKRFPDHAQGLRDYFVLAEAVQLRLISDSSRSEESLI